MKGGQKGGAWKGGAKGGQRFRTLVPIKCTIIWSSDESFRGDIWFFWQNHYGISNIAICPPFAPPFSKLLFLKKVEPHILPESKINFIRALVPKIRYVKVKNVIFYLKLTKREAKFDPRSVRKSLFFYTLNSNWNKSIFSSRNVINLIFGAKCFSDNNF